MAPSYVQNTILYHSSKEEFQPGQKLEARLSQTMQDWNVYDKFVEEVFEYIRQGESSDRPSRLRSVFTTTDPKYFDMPSNYYEVECSGNMFLTDQDIWSEASVFRQCRSDIEEHARKYWQGSENPRNPEILVDGEVKVIRKVEK